MAEGSGNGNGKSLFGLPLAAWLPVVAIVGAGGVAWGFVRADVSNAKDAIAKIEKKVDRTREDVSYIRGLLERRGKNGEVP